LIALGTRRRLGDQAPYLALGRAGGPPPAGVVV